MPRPKVFTVELADDDRGELIKLVTSGTHPARMIMRARVLLELDESQGRVDDRAVIAGRVGVSENTVREIAKRFAGNGGDVEVRVIALACSAPPAGYSRWSLRLLEKQVAVVAELPDLDHS
ncbi:MAG TPA: helix-turn-helix domain-containing protein, partial [Mycobacterium sp.]